MSLCYRIALASYSNLKTCKLFTDTIDCLGYTSCPKFLELASCKSDALRGLQPPTNLTQKPSFLGSFNDFHRFNSNFARISAPLSRRLKKDQPPSFYPFNSNEVYAMGVLANTLISLLTLMLPSSGGHIMLDVDACRFQIVCV